MGHAALDAAILIGIAALAASANGRGNPVEAKQKVEYCEINNVAHWPYPKGNCYVMHAPGQTIPTGEDHECD
eukprot:10759353-Karenia_brevis.AAC.1